MFYIFFAGVSCVWLVISAVIHAGLWHGFLHRLTFLENCLFNLAASVILSPGVVVGHGLLLFPGGLAFLFGDDSARDRSILNLNLASWMVTFLVFSIRSWWLKKS